MLRGLTILYVNLVFTILFVGMLSLLCKCRYNFPNLQLNWCFFYLSLWDLSHLLHGYCLVIARLATSRGNLLASSLREPQGSWQSPLSVIARLLSRGNLFSLRHCEAVKPWQSPPKRANHEIPTLASARSGWRIKFLSLVPLVPLFLCKYPFLPPTFKRNYIPILILYKAEYPAASSIKIIMCWLVIL